MNKKQLMIGLLSFTTLAAFTATIDVQAASMNGTSNHGQDMRIYGNQNHHQDRGDYHGVGMGMHTHDRNGSEHAEHHQPIQLPPEIQEATAPAYTMGEKVILEAGHMPGMEGAKAWIVGAYDTIAYEVTYQPTDGSPIVENHMWIVQEEIAEAKDHKEPLKPGKKVTLEANHMPGMEGATATIDSAVVTTVYMIDYKPTDGGPLVRNHKWFTEDEFSQAPDKGYAKYYMRSFE